VLDALARAAASGIDCQLIHQIDDAPADLSVGISTRDPDTVVSVLELATRREHLLRTRSQSGPDEWDYPFALPPLRDSLALRLTLGERETIVPLASWQAASLAAFGWRDLPERMIPACVHEAEFDEALGSLVAPLKQ
jgi:hypothetical protein